MLRLSVAVSAIMGPERRNSQVPSPPDRMSSRKSEPLSPVQEFWPAPHTLALRRCQKERPSVLPWENVLPHFLTRTLRSAVHSLVHLLIVVFGPRDKFRKTLSACGVPFTFQGGVGQYC